MANRFIKGRTIKLEKLWEILANPDLYDLLPGDGQDDYILQWLRERIWEASDGPKK